MKKRLQFNDWRNLGLCLDGYPKSLKQAKYLRRDLGIEVDLVIILETSDETIMKRSLNMKLDPESGITYTEKDVIKLKDPIILNRLRPMVGHNPDMLNKRMNRWEELNVVLTSQFRDKIVRVDSESSEENVIEKLSFMIENYSY